MDFDFDDRLHRGLVRYVRLVSQALGLGGDSWYVQAEQPASAYVALEERFDHCPDRDVALLWDEVHGWSVAIETTSGEDLRTVAYFGSDLLPPPDAVARWVRDLDHVTDHEGRPRAASLADIDSVLRRLTVYTGPHRQVEQPSR